ncbi:hypothetical protein FJTKL_14923 [Diaporthe vaccinii]|uniref:Uncharacterized protein n=1 Tax=Diaporthe vaccinii TaxID=105482 RepID=A0ABR4E6R7_9PEZI
MGKERPLLGVTKKKVSEDKVSKHESRHKKHKRPNAKPENSDDESSKDPIEQEGGVSLCQHDDENATSDEPLTKEEKKRRKKEKRFREEALKQLMDQELGPSPTASGLHVEAGAERKGKRKRDKRSAQQAQQSEEAEEACVTSTEAHEPADGEDVFMVDVNPTPANREKLRAQSEDEDMEDGGALLPEMQPGYTVPPSGKNRVIRRRLQLIDRERARIQKKLGVKEGSAENAQKVQQLLNEFIKTYDAKAEQREIRKNERKRKESIRLRCRRGKAPGSRN